MTAAAVDPEQAVAHLAGKRKRNRGARASMAVLALLAVGSWVVGDFGAAELVSTRRLSNLNRFLGELIPFPLRTGSFEWDVLVDWAGGLLETRGFEAAVNTLAISIAAIVIAGCGGALLSVLGARTLMTPSPYVGSPRTAPAPMRLLWLAVMAGSRFLMVFWRAIPEYVWAFLFLAVLGPMAWPLVLALALHNTGILGRLGAEVVENTEAAPLTALRAAGATRGQLVVTAIFPLAFSRFLLFFLYRWETCVREATVLGMVGISSLGFWIQDARARTRYDEMFFLIVLGGILVLIGDLTSALAREWVRRKQ